MQAQTRPKCLCCIIPSLRMAIKAPGVQLKPPPIQVEFSVTAVFRVRIVDLRARTCRCHCAKVARQTPPCESERGRQNPSVLESAEGVTQGHFDATVTHVRVHLRTIAIPHCLGNAPSNPSRWLRGSVLLPLLMAGHFGSDQSRVSSTPQAHWRSVCSAFLN